MLRDLLRGRGRIMLAVVALVVAVPAVASATHIFDDVPDDHTFHDDIAWLFGNGITMGCDDQNYCPDEPITRGQIAAMFRRFAEEVGLEGPQGPAGKNGVDGLSGWEMVSGTSVEDGTTDKHAFVVCPPGKVLTGGGVTANVPDRAGAVFQSYPSSDTAWHARMYDNPDTTEAWRAVVWAICVTAPPTP